MLPSCARRLPRARASSPTSWRRRTLGEAGDPRSRIATLRTLAREAADGDRQEALEFARRALALLDVTEEERELASLRAR